MFLGLKRQNQLNEATDISQSMLDIAITILEIFCNEWGPWTECSATCGGGQMMHVRQCTREDGFTFFQNETVACNTQQCERGKAYFRLNGNDDERIFLI